MSPNAFEAASALFEKCTSIRDFIGQSVRPQIDRAVDRSTGTERERFITYQTYLLRIQAWLSSFGKLNHPTDFQPLVAGSRALCEMAVDLTLLRFGDPPNDVEKLLAWERSSKLHAAKSVVDFYTRSGLDLPPDMLPRERFIAEQGPAIEAERKKYWEKGKHPRNRWTGRTLAADAKRSDELEHGAGMDPSEFERWCKADYPFVCWNTHGSGGAGVRSISAETFPGIAVLAFDSASDFAMVAAHHCMVLTGTWDGVSQARFREFHNQIILKVGARMGFLGPKA